MSKEETSSIKRVPCGHAGDTVSACTRALRVIVFELPQSATATDVFCMVADEDGRVFVEQRPASSLRGLAMMVGHAAASRVLASFCLNDTSRSEHGLTPQKQAVIRAHASAAMSEASEMVFFLHQLAVVMPRVMKACAETAAIQMQSVSRKEDPLYQRLGALQAETAALVKFVNHAGWPSPAARQAIESHT